MGGHACDGAVGTAVRSGAAGRKVAACAAKAACTADNTDTADVMEDQSVWQENGVKVTVSRNRAVASGASVKATYHDEASWPNYTRFQKYNQMLIEYPNMKVITITLNNSR